MVTDFLLSLLSMSSLVSYRQGRWLPSMHVQSFTQYYSWLCCFIVVVLWNTI